MIVKSLQILLGNPSYLWIWKLGLGEIAQLFAMFTLMCAYHFNSLTITHHSLCDEAMTLCQLGGLFGPIPFAVTAKCVIKCALPVGSGPPCRIFFNFAPLLTSRQFLNNLNSGENWFQIVECFTPCFHKTTQNLLLSRQITTQTDRWSRTSRMHRGLSTMEYRQHWNGSQFILTHYSCWSSWSLQVGMSVNSKNRGSSIRMKRYHPPGRYSWSTKFKIVRPVIFAFGMPPPPSNPGDSSSFGPCIFEIFIKVA